MSNKQIRYRNILEKSPIKYLCPICGSYHDVPEMMPLKKWKIEIKCPNFPEISAEYEVESFNVKETQNLYVGIEFEREFDGYCYIYTHAQELIGKNEEMALSYKENKETIAFRINMKNARDFESCYHCRQNKVCHWPRLKKELKDCEDCSVKKKCLHYENSTKDFKIIGYRAAKKCLWYEINGKSDLKLGFIFEKDRIEEK